MTASMMLPPEVAAYRDMVREALRDLPAHERDDLLAEVEASLLDTASEGMPIAERLGPPDAFAAELRAAAGLQPAAPAAEQRSAGLLEELRTTAVRLAAHPRVGALRRLAGELAPIWWLARAYVAVALVASVAANRWVEPATSSSARPGGPTTTLLVLAAAAALSIAVGLRSRTAGLGLRRVTAAANVVLALVAVPLGMHLLESPPTRVAYVAVPQAAGTGLLYDGTPVRNLYPYSRDGRLLHDVLLYDGHGRPIEIGRGEHDPARRVLRARDGAEIFHSFPIRYFAAGTNVVTHPNAAPSVTVPQIETPPLKPRRRR